MAPTPSSNSEAERASASGSEASYNRSDASAPTVSVPNAAVDRTADDSSRLRTFLSILKKFIGVTDIASVRFSLPAQLMEPVPNLEYWNYLDRPETFASIGDSEEPLGRMLGALRFWFTKDLKFVKGKPVKPYNSTLGEIFRCNWEVKESPPPILGSIPKSFSQATPQKPIRISYFTEQTSHHPPVSAYFISCPQRGIIARGFDQISVNFTGTRIRVAPGPYNQGIFVTLMNRAEETYHLTHPVAHLSGLLKGVPTITVGDTCYVTCAKTKLKAILHYAEEGWLGKAQNKLQGVVFKYDPENDNRTRAKDVPDADVVARIDGCWHEQIYYTLGNKSFDKGDKKLIVDVGPLWPAPKIIPPENEQLPNESRKVWAPVTEAILSKKYTEATDAKTEIEERQRQKATDRKERGTEWVPRFFKSALAPAGRPELSKDGLEAIERLTRGDYKLEPNKETAA